MVKQLHQKFSSPRTEVCLVQSEPHFTPLHHSMRILHKQVPLYLLALPGKSTAGWLAPSVPSIVWFSIRLCSGKQTLFFIIYTFLEVFGSKIISWELATKISSPLGLLWDSGESVLAAGLDFCIWLYFDIQGCIKQDKLFTEYLWRHQHIFPSEYFSFCIAFMLP